MDTRTLNTLAARFRLLGNPSRLRLLALLVESGELPVSALCDRLQQAQPAVSHHLSLLRSAGLIRGRRAWKQVFYSVADAEHITLLLSQITTS
jgi:ArsR family transcriptional regulator, arsenate/arsenite/antimonite-responsive transcriptional repressor